MSQLDMKTPRIFADLSLVAICCTLLTGCPAASPTNPDNDNGNNGNDNAAMDDGPVADGIAGKLGDPMPSATEEQLATFERGKSVFLRHFTLGDGLGPAFNLTSCGGCHERPQPGGNSGLYRNFFLAGRETEDGAFVFSESAGMAGGVIRVFNYDSTHPFRPQIPDTTTIFAQRNAIPFFGMGLIAELPEEALLSRVDEDDADGDGISGRANFDRGFVGRFGRKSQTVSLEGFIRGPLFNHLGITTVPLTDELRSQLPIDSSAQATMKIVESLPPAGKSSPHMQAAAPDAPNSDEDAAADPELSQLDLFDLVSFQMLLAAPEFDEPTEPSNRGRELFHEANCSGCHVPRIDGPRGPVPAYSDFLLHDMGPELADGIRQGVATGSEFRTQPLWGIVAVGPYLHDGRAESIEEAILDHGGEATAARDAFAAFSEEQRADVIEFLTSLGGRDQYSPGLVEPNTPVPAVGSYGGPVRALSDAETERFLAGRAAFDRDFGHAHGVGGQASIAGDMGPRFNGDSCRACHSQPVLGGAGRSDVNVMRHGIVDADGVFSAPPYTPNTILHKEVRVGFLPPKADIGVNVFEHRQTPPLFGLGLIDQVSDETILSHADSDDADNDGVSGRPHMMEDGRIGRIGWKAQFSTVAEFNRDAMAAEMGITIPPQPGMIAGMAEDNDGTPDPELSLTDLEDLNFFMSLLAPPPRQPADDAAQVAQGEQVFATTGCTKCHVPDLGPAEGVFTDLLLHEILPETSVGIVDMDADMREFRTAPLWGLSQSAPYFHTGEADTIDQAIRMHAGEANAVLAAYENLPTESRDALLAFLNTL